MTAPRRELFLAAAACLALGWALAGGQESSSKTILLHVSKGQVPPDTGMDGKTTPEIVDNVKEMPGKVLKVAFAAGDSFGSKTSAGKDWKRFAHFRFNAFNPAKTDVALELVVLHARSTSFQTRVVVPIKLKPGKNEVKIGIDEMTNVNGSAPNLAKVVKWYINDAGQKGPTVYFSDIWLEGGEPAPAQTGTGAAPSQPLVGYKIKGKVGTLEIDVTVTPFVVGGKAARAAGRVRGDPAR